MVWRQTFLLYRKNNVNVIRNTSYLLRYSVIVFRYFDDVFILSSLDYVLSFGQRYIASFRSNGMCTNSIVVYGAVLQSKRLWFEQTACKIFVENFRWRHDDHHDRVTENIYLCVNVQSKFCTESFLPYWGLRTSVLRPIQHYSLVYGRLCGRDRLSTER